MINIGISNIAFKGCSFDETLRRLSVISLRGVEIAPTLLWDDPIVSSKAKRNEIKKLCSNENIRIIGLQSLLFNRPELRLFNSVSMRDRCQEYIKRLIQLCADLGGALLVFGAANNRKRGSLPFDNALSIAKSFFFSLASAAKDADVLLCIEPISSHYGCDFITTADEGAMFVRLVDHPNFRLILDTGSMILNGESCADMIVKHADVLEHMYINDPYLSFPGKKGGDHSLIADALRKIDYREWVTLEFLTNSSFSIETIDYVLRCYGHKAKQ